MATVFSHAVVAAALGTTFAWPAAPARVWVVGAVCAVVPDLDVIGLSFGIPWGHVLGHRGFSHSLLFAAILAAVVIAAAFRGSMWDGTRTALWVFLFLATASHGILDAMTDGGLGVAFWAPFDDTRYFLPWRPIPVSPMGLGFFSPYGWRVLADEIVMLWLPAAIVTAAALSLRRRAGRRP